MERFSALKDPDAVMDYQIDWTDWLGADTIVTATWTIPAGVTSTGDSNTEYTTTVFISGGTIGAVYPILCRVDTTGGRTTDRTIRLLIADK